MASQAGIPFLKGLFKPNFFEKGHEKIVRKHVNGKHKKNEKKITKVAESPLRGGADRHALPSRSSEMYNHLATEGFK